MKWLKKLFYKNCKHKDYRQSVFEDNGNNYILQICNKCKKGRMITQYKYIKPTIYQEWK